MDQAVLHRRLTGVFLGELEELVTLPTAALFDLRRPMTTSDTCAA